MLLLPLFATFYKDDEGRSQPVLVNGQSGQISGARRASMKTGQRAAPSMLAAAMVIFLVSLGLSAISLAFPPLLALGVIGLVVALLVGLERYSRWRACGGLIANKAEARITCALPGAHSHICQEPSV